MDINRCRFVPYTPAAINALSFSQRSGRSSSLRLAVGRANGNIEIWNPSNGAWAHETTLWGGQQRSIEGLLWTREIEVDTKTGQRSKTGTSRLFSIGYNDAVVEWDLALGQPKRQVLVNEVWCFAAQPLSKSSSKKRKRSEENGNDAESEETEYQDIVVGCGDGSIILLSTEDDDLTIKKYITRPSKNRVRILSITWQDSNTIVAGFADGTLRIYDVRTGHHGRTMALGAGAKGGPKETLVWTIECLKDRTIVSGDSTGTITVWDGRTYTQLQQIKAHEADVLCLSSSEDGQTLFSGGMDRKTIVYKLELAPNSIKQKRWVKASTRRYHDHDVKAMTGFSNKKLGFVVSGGRDTQLAVIPSNELEAEHHRKLPPVPQQPPIAGASRLLMCWQENEIAIWRIAPDAYLAMRSLGVDDESTESEKKGYSKVGSLSLKHTEEHITSASLSHDGTLLAVSTVAELKFFRLDPHPTDAAKIARICKVDVPPSIASLGARSVQFSPDSKHLLVITSINALALVPLEGFPTSLTKPTYLPTAQPRQADLPNHVAPGYAQTLTRAAWSSDSTSFAVSDLSGVIQTYTFRASAPNIPSSPSYRRSSTSSTSSTPEEPTTWTRTSTIHLPSPPLVLSYQPQTNTLLVLTTEHTLHLYLENGTTAPWSQRNPSSMLPAEFQLQRDRAAGALWDPRGRAWVYGATWLAMFDFTKDLPRPIGVPAADLQGVPANAVYRAREAVAARELDGARGALGGAGSRVDGKGSMILNGKKRTAASDSSDEDEDEETPRDGAIRAAKARARTQLREDAQKETAMDAAESKKKARAAYSASALPFFITSRYQPILGVVALQRDDGEESKPLEVALVERPAWDLELPPRLVTCKDAFAQ